VVVVDVLEVDPPTPPDPTALLADGEGRPEQAVPAEPAPEPQATVPPKRSRLRTVRGALLVLVPLLLIIGVAAGILGWYARSSSFVGADNNEVVIFKGVPGGVLGWNPTVDRRTGIRVADLPQLDRDRVQTNSTRGSLATATAYVTRLAGATTTTTLPRTTT